MINNSYNS